MPVRQMAPGRTSEHERFVADLLDEWTRDDSANPEPIIFEERDGQRRLEHVYVIWQAWDHVDRVERSEIIMDAAERKLPVDELLNISIAMGLTPAEARRMGMTF